MIRFVNMNVLTNNIKCLPGTVSYLLKNKSAVSRGYAFKTNLKIKWYRPAKISAIGKEKSGDLGIDVPIAPTDIALRYSQSSELADADDTTKTMLSLGFLPKRETAAVQREKIMGLVKRHPLDRGSMEVKIAAMTAEILRMQEYMDAKPYDKVAKTFLKELIEKRKKFLGYLRTWDYRRFEWLLEKLNLVYHPHPPEYKTIARKESMRKLTDTHCENIRKSRLDKYRAELEEEQKTFYKEKADKLAFIRQEELACGLSPTVTEEEIENARKKASTFE